MIRRRWTLGRPKIALPSAVDEFELNAILREASDGDLCPPRRITGDPPAAPILSFHAHRGAILAPCGDFGGFRAPDVALTGDLTKAAEQAADRKSVV